MKMKNMKEGTYYREVLGIHRMCVKISKYMGPVSHGRNTRCRMERPDGKFSMVPSSSIERVATDEEVQRAYPS